MSTQKRVFFGSHFDFSNNAVDEIRARFSACIEGCHETPFTSYDKINRTFSFVCDQSDLLPVQLFLSTLKEYLELEHGRLDLRDQELVDESPKIKPIEGTFIPDFYTLDDLTSPEERLIDHLEDGTTDSDEDEGLVNAKPDGMASITQYWIPEFGDTNILNTNIAQEIAQLTDSSLDPEPARKRVRIYGGNFNEALFRLKNLEKLMELLASQRLTKSPKSSDNILILRKGDEDAIIEFVRLHPDSKAYLRILVDEYSREHLDRKCIGELRKREVYNEPPTAPKNLYELYPTKENQETKIWENFKYPTIGDESNAQPSVEPDLSIGDNRDGGLLALTATPSKYLTANANMNIARWTEDVTEPLDPGIAVEPPNDGAAQNKRVRKVATDSEDEDSDNEKPRANVVAPMETTRSLDQLLMSGSESRYSMVVDANAAQSNARKRFVAVSSNESDAEEQKQENANKSLPHMSEANLAIALPASEQVKSIPMDKALQMVRQLALEPPVQISQPASLPAKSTRTPFVDFQQGRDVTQHHGYQTLQDGTQSAMTLPVLAPSPTPRNTSDHSPHLPYGPQSNPPPGPSFPSTAEFDSTRYGTRSKKSRGARRGRGSQSSGSTSQQITQCQQSSALPNRASRGSHDAGDQVANRDDGIARIQAWPALSNKTHSVTSTGFGRGQSRGQPSRSRGSGHHGTSEPHVRALIGQISPPRASTVVEPPGLGIRYEPVEGSGVPVDALENSSHQPLNILDDPVEEIHRPSLQPVSSPVLGLEAPEASLILRLGSNGSSVSRRFYVNTHNPGLNITGIENDRLAELLRIQARETQRRQDVDETSTRRTHKTMGQKASNLSSKHAKAEKKQERKARLAKVKEESYPLVRAAKSQLNSISMSDGDSQTPAAKVTRFAKKLPQPVSSIISPEEKLRNQQTQRLITMLDPLFEAARAFPGKVSFEIQFGQALVPISNVQLNQPYTTSAWDSLFHPTRGVHPISASFTNILTTNGADIDRLLNTKAAPGKGSVKMWDKQKLDQGAVTYEFSCQSKENDEFCLVVNQDGTHTVRKANTAIGLVNLHYPGQVWDACAVLSGPMNWMSLPEETATAAAAFASSLYIPAEQTSLNITYRLPSTHEITVRSLVSKRTSHHQCLYYGLSEFQMRTTEIKTLYHRFNQKDKKLGQAFEKPFEQMVQDGRIHYEVSLVHTGTNAILAKNEGLVLGHLSDESMSGRKLLVHDKIKDLLDLTTHMVFKMDWMGAHNIGTLCRLEDVAVARGQSLGPGASRIGGSVIPASRITGMDTEKIVHGVRARTKAEILSYDGQLYQRGYGGARVPFIAAQADDLDCIGEEDVQPDDSASAFALPREPTRYLQRPFDPRAMGPGFW